MSLLYAAYKTGGLTATQVGELRDLVTPCDSFFASGLYVRLVNDEFQFMDEGGPLGSTKSLDAALTILSAGITDARSLLGITTPYVSDEELRAKVEPMILVEMDPAQQAAARRLRESMNERRSNQTGPVDHSKEGATVRVLGEGDGDVIKG